MWNSAVSIECELMKFAIEGTVLFFLECGPKHFATGFVTVHVAIKCEKVQSSI